MKSKLFAILFSLVLLLMAFSAAAADHLTNLEAEESGTSLNPRLSTPRNDYWGVYWGDIRYSQEGTSLVSRISIAGADYWSFFRDQLDSQEGASLVSRISIAGADYWSFFRDQLDSQESSSLNPRYSTPRNDYWGIYYGDPSYSQ